MENLIRFVVDEILGAENYELIITEQADQITHYSITPDPEMAGQLIGKKGKIISSLRQLLRACGILHQARWTLTVETAT